MGSEEPCPKAPENTGPSRCIWPNCIQYEIPPTKLCMAHVTIVVRHAADIPGLADNVEALTSPWRTPAATRQTDPTIGTIYYLRSGGHFKIGWTANLERRMKGYPPDTTLLAVRPGTKADERATHRRFSHLLSHGREWFMLAPEVQDHIDHVIDQHGPPPVVDFTARRAKRVVGPRLNGYVGGPNRGNLASRQVRG